MVAWLCKRHIITRFNVFAKRSFTKLRIEYLGNSKILKTGNPPSQFGMSGNSKTLLNTANFPSQFTMSKPVIAIDIDDTLAPFLTVFTEYYNELYTPKIDLDVFVSTEFTNVFGGGKDECSKIVYDFFESQHITRIKPYNNTFEILSRLLIDFDLHVVTARHHESEEFTRQWINTYYPNIFTELHFGNHYGTGSGAVRTKSEICKDINAIMLIDDNYDYIVDCLSNNIYGIFYGNYAWYTGQYTLSTTTHTNTANSAATFSGTVTTSSVASSSTATTVSVVAALPTSTTNTTTDIHKKALYRCHNWHEVYDSIYNICSKEKILLKSTHFKIAAIQMCSTNNIAYNINNTILLVNHAISQGALLVCLPECCSYMGLRATDVLEVASDLNRPNEYLTRLCEVCELYIHCIL